MAKIEDILNLDLSKIEKEPLKVSVKKFIDGYKAEEEKELFKEAAKKSIDTLYRMVKDHAPKAIAKSDHKEASEKSAKSKKRGNFGKIVRSVIDQLTDLLENYEGDDLVGHLENTIHGLNKALLSDGNDKEVTKGVTKSLESFYAFEGMIEENQKLRYGDIVADDIPVRKKALSIIDQLLRELRIEKSKPVNPKPKASAKRKPKDSIQILRRLTHQVAEALNKLSEDLEGQDETIVDSTIMDLDNAFDQHHDTIFLTDLKSAIKSFDDWANDISNKTIRKQSISEIQKLKEELEKHDKQKSESEAKSKKVLEKVKEYDADIEACRIVIREFNKKKRESQPAKPKPTRLTKLKNHIAAIIKLTPPAIEGDETVQEGNRKGSEMILNHFMPLWGMNRVKEARSSMEKELDEIEGKIEGKEQKELAQRWKHDLPDTDKIIAYEKKNNKHLLEEAALQIVDHIGESIKLYRDDKSKAFKFLKEKFNQDQLKEYLPKYILDELKEETKKK